MYIEENLRKKLTDDDIKVLKHLQSIDNLFKKGNLNIFELFVDNGTMKVTILLDGIDYEIANFHHITCDGGDPDRYGCDGIHSYNELIDKLDEEYEEYED
jgi:hypothetical protein